MNDVDEVADKLNSVIRMLNRNGMRMDELCTHWNTDWDDYDDLVCNDCGAVIEHSED